MTLPSGTWWPYPGFEGLYVVSDEGLVHSLPRATTAGQLINPRHDPNGYPVVTLSKDGVHSHHRVHVMVLTTFRGPCPPGKEGAHHDGNKDNCKLSNLFWKTKRENILDAVRHGTHHNGSKARCRWGHDFTRANTRLDSRNRRVCRTCDRTRSCKRPDCASELHDHAGTPWKG